MKVAHIQPSEDIIKLHKNGIPKVFFEIEHLCSAEVWEKWKECGLVSLRSDQDMQAMFSGLVPRNKTLDSVIEDLVQDSAIRETVLMFEPGDLKTKRMILCLKENFKDKAVAFSGFARTITDIEAFFCNYLRRVFCRHEDSWTILDMVRHSFWVASYVNRAPFFVSHHETYFVETRLNFEGYLF